ncbi:kinase-like domain-containing protein [Lophiotrema nucula]|uniref:Kinase-like domain-containing protein n=1 Tax=Lophiotrema nucula TaxID=690887 RepID=A0A6A5YUD9_9PLEO|nr:kinase-like domain-containing protein [Lophiotrema nucula]
MSFAWVNSSATPKDYRLRKSKNMVSNDEDYSSFGRYSSLASLPPSSRLCTSAVLEHEEDQHAHYGFIAVLGLAQRLNVDILPLSWDIKQRPIGRGGQATIYHTMIDRESGFVFKCFDHIDQQQDLFRQVVQEMAVLGHPAVRAHPHINNLEGLCWNVIDENQIWPALVFEKSHLGDLDSFVKTQRAIELSIEDRLELCVQIGIAIRDMHANGIVHGDIKPGNILVFEADTGRITVKMTDFGWSTWFRAERKAILMPRSLPWNAPEHMWQTVEMKEAKLMDVYSYGLLCLWLLLCVDSASASRSFRALDWMQYLGFTTERSLLHAWKQDQDDPLLKWAIWALSEHGTFDIDMEQDLVKFFKSCLTFDPYMRNMNWQHLLELLAPNR